MDIEVFVGIALAGPAPKRSDITDEEFIEIIRRVLTGEGSEVELRFWDDLLEVNLGPAFSEIMSWPEMDLPPADILAAARRGSADALSQPPSSSVH
jgi:hypothetical protein